MELQGVDIAKAGGVKNNFRVDVGSEASIGEGSAKLKVGGIGVSIGKEIGFSTPFGGVSVNLYYTINHLTNYFALDVIKKFRRGEEVSKSTFSYILINDRPLNSDGVFCKNCAKKFDKNQQRYKVFAIILLILNLVFILSVVFYFFLMKKELRGLKRLKIRGSG